MPAISMASPRPAGSQPTLPTPKSPPSKTQIRKPALLRKKRDAADMDLNPEDPPSSPSKRARVAFSDAVEIKIVHEWEKAPELISHEVRRVLRRHTLDDDGTDYDRLLGMFVHEASSEDPPSPTTLRNYTAALASSGSSLGRSQIELVRMILDSEWLWRDGEYVEIFVRFLGNLVSAQGVWLAHSLKMLVQKFADSCRPRTPLRHEAFVPEAQAEKRIHAALRYILRLVPSAGGVLGTILENEFPSSTDSKRRHAKYISNLLSLIDYASEVQSGVLALITERLVKIDVKVQVDLEDLADELEDGVVKDISKRRNQSGVDSESEEESDSDDDDLDAEVRRAKEINRSVEKMDLILDILFDYYTNFYDSHTPTQGHTAVATAPTVASTLMSHFSAFILPTYRSRHTQFLMFHFFQSSPALVENFVGNCLEITVDKTNSDIMRQSAAAYLASFVSRGVRVSASVARDTFTLLSARLSALRTEYEPSCRGPDPRRYRTFYTLAQALIYIFCFRWRDLLVTKDDHPGSLSPPGLLSGTDDDDCLTPVFMPRVKDALTNVVFSTLNPLRVCAPSIVAEFAHITQRLHLLYVFTLIDTNKRVRLVTNRSDTSINGYQVRQSALSALRDDDWLILDAYFPFDPYKLPISKRWLEGDYREWKGLDEKDESESESEEGSLDGDDESADDTGTDEN